MAKHRRRRTEERRKLVRQVATRRARRAAADARGFALERLEPRQLLALLISQDVKGTTDIVYEDAESITISDNVVLDAGGGKISLTAPSITIGKGAKLNTSGAVTLTASRLLPPNPLPLTFSDQIMSWAEAIGGGEKVSVTVGSGASISGGTVTIDASAGDMTTALGRDKAPGWVKIYATVSQDVLGFLGNQLSALPIGFSIKNPSSTIFRIASCMS